MIDTIALTIPQDKYKIVDDSRFSPSTSGLFQPPYYTLGGRGNFSCYQNPTPEQLRQGIYLPRLTVIKRARGVGHLEIVLKIEFSAPKLLYGNNFDELTESDFPTVIANLLGKTRAMGVNIAETDLRQGMISAIHYSKNCAHIDYTTSSSIISELIKVGSLARLDFNQTDYRNGGHIIKWHANSYEFTVYDKMKDLEMAKISPKRTVEGDYATQLSLFDDKPPKRPFDVTRVELRLGRTKMKQLFSELGISSDFTFQSLFNSTLSQTLLLHFWDKVTANYKPADTSGGFKGFLVDFMIITNGVGPVRKALQGYGLKKSLEEMTIKEFRVLTGKMRGNYPRVLTRSLALLSNGRSWDGLKQIYDALQQFEPIRLKDFET